MIRIEQDLPDSGSLRPEQFGPQIAASYSKSLMNWNPALVSKKFEHSLGRQRHTNRINCNFRREMAPQPLAEKFPPPYGGE
jgi:hypothetical protein